MENGFELLFELADREFRGKTFNGPSLLETLRSLDPADAASEATFEGYSAWAVALHCAWCKWIVGKALIGTAGPEGLGDYPYPVGRDGFAAPADPSGAAWTALLAYEEELHGRVVSAMREADAARLDRQVVEWRTPAREAVVWLCGHDAYHNAQIRSMGVPGLRAARAY